MSKSELKRFHEATASCLNPQSAPANTSEHARAYKEAFASIMPAKETVHHPDHYNEGIETNSAPTRKARLNKESWDRVNEKMQKAKEHKEIMNSLKKETVNHPDHYNEGIETIDYIESWGMDFNQGNVIKYVSRYKLKGGLEDLKKAQWYLERLIQLEEKNV